MLNRCHKTCIDPEGRQYIHVPLCGAFRLPDGTTLLVTRLHNAVTVDPNRTPVYELLPRKEGRDLLANTLHLPFDQVDRLMPFEHDAANLTAPGEW